MNSRYLSRRQFGLLTGTGLLSVDVSRGQSKALTARQVVERIQKQVGVPWRSETVDTFKAGNPDTEVKGICTTFMATLDVLQRSAASGKNFIVTHEPTFWSHLDTTTELTQDPLYRHKVDFVAKHNLVVWRFHDHWHARKPDAITVAFNRALGWEKYQVADNLRRFVMPETTLEALAKSVQAGLKTRSLRVIGDPQLKVTRVGRGSHTLAGNMEELPNVDVLVVSEAREWDSIEYIRDTIALGQKKGMLLLAHEEGEELGMDDCAKWIRTFVPEVPIEGIPAGEPFWTV